MSGEQPPHHPHNRPWDYIGIPNWRQPQHAHMANKHSLMHQPNWHPPTTESMKVLGQLPHNFALHQMFENIPLTNQPPGVDLSRPGLNGEVPTSPISLSVKDTKRLSGAPETSVVDSLPKCVTPKIKSLESVHGESVSEMKITKRASPLDSVLERLKPSFVNSTEKSVELSKIPEICDLPQKSDLIVSSNLQDKSQSVIVPPPSSQDESSDSSTLNVPNSKEEETISPYNTEDSLDSNKSRRKRKPSKTLRCTKTEEIFFTENESFKAQEIMNTTKPVSNPVEICSIPTDKQADPSSETVQPLPIERRRSSSLDLNVLPVKTRRKTSSESETIDNIAAMVQEGLKEKEQKQKEAEKKSEVCNDITFVPVSVIKSKEEIDENICQESTVSESTTKVSTLITPAQKKETHFVEIENKLEEMFAGIEDTTDPLKTDDLSLEESKMEDPLLEDSVAVLTSQDNVSSTSNDLTTPKTAVKARKGKMNKKKDDLKRVLSKKANKNNLKNKKVLPKTPTKPEVAKEVTYDSSSNASSAKSKGPFLHIKGPRSSPFSVSIVNTPTKDEDDAEKKIKTKKFHDDSEYRHKVRSKGLHCSTLSHKYDAQTKDATWICVFCKKGPHTTEKSIGINCSFPSGDLFGPYFVTVDCEEYERRLEDPFDKNFKSKKIIKGLEASKQPPAKKAKKRHSETDTEMADPYLGIIETTNNSFEVWVHEDCLVWSPGVYLVGPKIIGLQEAVWTSCNVPCNRCNYKGANICCLYRGCMKVVHVWCAKSLNWDFDEECFKTFCDEHRKWDKIG